MRAISAGIKEENDGGRKDLLLREQLSIARKLKELDSR
jgi:hypothetical protein